MMDQNIFHPYLSNLVARYNFQYLVLRSDMSKNIFD